MSTITISAIVGTIISLGIYVSIANTDLKKTHLLKDFFFFDWSLSSKQVASTLFASGMSLATVIFSLLQLGVIFGVGLSWATITYCLGWLALALLSPRIRSMTKRTDTLHSFLGESFGSQHVMKLAAITTLIGFVGTFATEIFAASVLVKALGFNHFIGTIAICIFALVTIIYSSMGGFRAVIRSDRIQSILLVPAVIGIAILGLYHWSVNGKPLISQNPLANKFALPLSVAISIALINIIFPIVDMSAWQRILASRSNKAFKQGSLIAIIGFGFTWTVLIFIAILIAPTLNNEVNPFVSLISSIKSNNILGLLVGILIFPGLVAAMLSTGDTFLNAAGHTLSIDLLNIDPAKEIQGSEQRARWHVCLLGLIGLSTALALREIGFGIVDMIFAVYGSTLALFIPLCFSLINKKKSSLIIFRKAALVAIIGGVVAAWGNGLYSVTCNDLKNPLFLSLFQKFPPNVYRSPTCAVVVSTLLFLVSIFVIKICTFFSNRRKHGVQ